MEKNRRQSKKRTKSFQKTKKGENCTSLQMANNSIHARVKGLNLKTNLIALAGNNINPFQSSKKYQIFYILSIILLSIGFDRKIFQNQVRF